MDNFRARGFIHTRKSPSFFGNDAAANKLRDTMPREQAATNQQWGKVGNVSAKFA